MRYEILTNGSLLLLAGNSDRRELAEAIRNASADSYVAESFLDSLTFLQPEAIDALTEAPILTDDPDHSDDTGIVVPHDAAAVWWYPDYMVRDPWRIIACTGRVIFSKAT